MMMNDSAMRAPRRLQRAALAGVVGLLSVVFAACDPPVYGDHDLTVTVQGAPTRLGVGSTEGLNIYMRNSGTAAATNARIAVIFPGSISITESPIGSAPSCSAPMPFGEEASYIVCMPGDLAADTSRQELLTLHGESASGVRDLTIVALSDGAEDPAGDPNAVVLPIDVREPWLDLTPAPFGSLGTRTVGVGSSQIIEPKNLGPLSAPVFTYVGTYSSNITVTGAHASGYINGQLAQGSCNFNAQIVACEIPSGLGRYDGWQNDMKVYLSLTPSSAGPASVTHEVISGVVEVDDPTPNTVVQTGTVVAP